jgi:hypothetical protein
MNQCLQYDKFHYKSASWHSPSFLQIKTKQRPSEKPTVFISFSDGLKHTLKTILPTLSQQQTLPLLI